MQTVVDGNLSCRHIGNHHRNEEGADALGTFVEKPLIGTMHGLDAADARTDIGADAVMILCIEVKPRIRDRHACGHNGELGIAIHALCLFLIDITVDTKVLDFACNLRSVARRIKTSDLINTVFPRKQGVPKGVLSNADRRNGTNPRNDNSLLQTNRLLSRSILGHSSSLPRAVVSALQISHEHSKSGRCAACIRL